MVIYLFRKYTDFYRLYKDFYGYSRTIDLIDFIVILVYIILLLSILLLSDHSCKLAAELLSKPRQALPQLARRRVARSWTITSPGKGLLVPRVTGGAGANGKRHTSIKATRAGPQSTLISPHGQQRTTANKSWPAHDIIALFQESDDGRTGLTSTAKCVCRPTQMTTPTNLDKEDLLKRLMLGLPKPKQARAIDNRTFDELQSPSLRACHITCAHEDLGGLKFVISKLNTGLTDLHYVSRKPSTNGGGFAYL